MSSTYVTDIDSATHLKTELSKIRYFIIWVCLGFLFQQWTFWFPGKTRKKGCPWSHNWFDTKFSSKAKLNILMFFNAFWTINLIWQVENNGIWTRGSEMTFWLCCVGENEGKAHRLKKLSLDMLKRMPIIRNLRKTKAYQWMNFNTYRRLYWRTKRLLGWRKFIFYGN